MRRTSIMVCPERCGAEENLRCLERGESSGVVLNSQQTAADSSDEAAVVLKIAANRSRQLGEVCASTLSCKSKNHTFCFCPLRFAESGKEEGEVAAFL